MSITKKIGKNTVGDNNKMTVRLNNYYRSTHDLSYVWKNTQAVGTLVPFLCEYAQIDDTHEIDLSAMVITHPTVGPLYGSFKLQLDLYVAPIRLYQKLLHNNTLGIGLDMSKVKLPTIKGTINQSDNPNKNNEFSQISTSALLAYLGLRGWGKAGQNQNGVIIKKNGVPLLAYWDIYKNYYANKQEEIGYVLNPRAVIATGSVGGIVVNNFQNRTHFNSGSITIIVNNLDKDDELLDIYDGFVKIEQTGNLIKGQIKDILGEATYDSGNEQYIWTYKTENDGYISLIYNNDLGVKSFELKKIDQERESILSANSTVPYEVLNALPYYYYGRDKNNELETKIAQFGLGLKTYQSDIFNNWIQTEWLDGENGINAITAIDVSSGEFTMDTLNLAKKVYNMLNRIAVSDGTYKSWMETVFSSKYVERTETPVYYGGMSQEIIFEEVVSTAAASEEPLGSLAGKGRLAPNKKGGKIIIKIDEPSYIIGIASITPRLDYSQGNNFTMNWETLNDVHKPALDMIGFQDLTLEKAAWWTEEHTSSGIKQKSVGKTVAWIDYMTNYNKNYGNFASGQDENFMVLDRNFSIENNDFTTYIDPKKWNGIFADQSREAMNFWIQIGVDWEVRRKISAKSIPNL